MESVQLETPVWASTTVGRRTTVPRPRVASTKPNRPNSIMARRIVIMLEPNRAARSLCLGTTSPGRRRRSSDSSCAMIWA